MLREKQCVNAISSRIQGGHSQTNRHMDKLGQHAFAHFCLNFTKGSEMCGCQAKLRQKCAEQAEEIRSLQLEIGDKTDQSQASGEKWPRRSLTERDANIAAVSQLTKSEANHISPNLRLADDSDFISKDITEDKDRLEQGQGSQVEALGSQSRLGQGHLSYRICDKRECLDTCEDLSEGPTPRQSSETGAYIKCKVSPEMAQGQIGRGAASQLTGEERLTVMKHNNAKPIEEKPCKVCTVM